MADEKSQEGAPPAREGAGGGDSAGAEPRPASVAPFDPRDLTREVMGATGSSAFKRPTASAVEAARPPTPTLTDPSELEAARRRSLSGPPSSELSMVNRNSPSIPPTSKPITMLDDEELSPLDRGWLEDEIDTAQRLVTMDDVEAGAKPTAPPVDPIIPAEAKKSAPPAPLAPSPTPPRAAPQTTDDMFAELALEDDDLGTPSPVVATPKSPPPAPSPPEPPLVAMAAVAPPPPPTAPAGRLPIELRETPRPFGLDDLVGREPSAILTADDLGGQLVAREPSGFAHTAVRLDDLVAREPSGIRAPSVARPTPAASPATSDSQKTDGAAPSAAVAKTPVVEMKERFSLGDYTGALEVAEDILTTSPDDVDARDCAEQSRAVLVQMYTAKIGPLDKVPQVMVPREQLRWLSLDHRAGFVLSLVDGMSSLEMILDMSGMPALDAMRILFELTQQRIITLR